MSFDLDAEVNSGLQLSQSAADQDKIAAIQTGDKIGATLGDHMPVKEWMSNLPKNITVGVMDAARNTVDAVNGFGALLDHNLKERDRRAREDGTDMGGPPQPSAQELRMAALERGSQTDVSDPNPYSDHTGFRAHYQAFRDELASGSTPSDDVTQSIAQFGVPMFGWTKLLGVQKAISLTGFGAEALTASTALAPHQGRNADLIALGKTMEGKLGTALNTISPDGSALNAYINYMTDRSGESEAEGRFKNVIDSIVTTASGAALLKTGATAIKVGRDLPAYIAENAGNSRVGPGAQEGKIVFHGTGANFDEFDSAKIGSGEGNQAFGNGLYFAEDRKTAGTYQQMLAGRGAHPDLISAAADVAKAGGDKQKAYVALTTAANKSENPSERMFLNRKAQLIKGGAVDRARGTLMHVDIPDEHLANMVDHDAPISEQPPAVQAAFERAGVLDPADTRLITGGDAYAKLSNQLGEGTADDRAASAYLSGAGVPGIKFFDQRSPGKTEGTRNIVLFDAKHAKIVKKE